MQIRKHLTKAEFDFMEVSKAEMAGLAAAIQHEILRSQARQQDERISVANRELERANQKMLRGLGHAISDAMGDRVEEKAQAS